MMYLLLIYLFRNNHHHSGMYPGYIYSLRIDMEGQYFHSTKGPQRVMYNINFHLQKGCDRHADRHTDGKSYQGSVFLRCPVRYVPYCTGYIRHPKNLYQKKKYVHL